MGAGMREDFGIEFLYDNPFGRVLLHFLTRPICSKAVGSFMDTRASKVMISAFIKNNKIDMSQYIPAEYGSFNEFFTRPVRPEKRPVDMADAALIAPCDSRLSVYSITPHKTLSIKGQRYSLSRLLGSRALAEEFTGGYSLVFRLSTDDYHRYCYFDHCRKGRNTFIPGVLHTVRPGALERSKVFTENAREYTVLQTRNFGKAVQVEVGAMMVGRIKNHHGIGEYARGVEKGMFEFGGSTVILLLKPDKAFFRDDIAAAVDANTEIKVRIGEKIGDKVGK